MLMIVMFISMPVPVDMCHGFVAMAVPVVLAIQNHHGEQHQPGGHPLQRIGRFAQGTPGQCQSPEGRGGKDQLGAGGTELLRRINV